MNTWINLRITVTLLQVVNMGYMFSQVINIDKSARQLWKTYLVIGVLLLVLFVGLPCVTIFVVVNYTIVYHHTECIHKRDIAFRELKKSNV